LQSISLRNDEWSHPACRDAPARAPASEIIPGDVVDAPDLEMVVKQTRSTPLILRCLRDLFGLQATTQPKKLCRGRPGRISIEDCTMASKAQPASPHLTKPPFDVLVLDVGGTNVKLRATGQNELVKIPSGKSMSPRQMMSAVRRKTAEWSVQAVSIGLPGIVLHGRILHEPRNLGKGWVGFDFGKTFRLPVKVINDAAMQALGSYRGGRMLFLALGTGLGSAFIVDGRLEALELAHLLYRKDRTYEDYVGARALERLGCARLRGTATGSFP